MCILYQQGDGWIPQTMVSHVSGFISGVNGMNGRPIQTSPSTSLFRRPGRKRCIVAQWTRPSRIPRASVFYQQFGAGTHFNRSPTRANTTPTQQSSTRPSAMTAVRSETRRHLEEAFPNGDSKLSAASGTYMPGVRLGILASTSDSDRLVD
jgi:hypothetical protein